MWHKGYLNWRVLLRRTVPVILKHGVVVVAIVGVPDIVIVARQVASILSTLIGVVDCIEVSRGRMRMSAVGIVSISSTPQMTQV